jgi:anti-sigma B factor antagonist
MNDHGHGAGAPLAFKVSGAAGSVSVVGELDLNSAPELRLALLDAAGADRDHVVIDLAEVSFIDSSGLRELISHHREGFTFTLRNPSPAVLRIFELTQTVDVFDIDRGC